MAVWGRFKLKEGGNSCQLVIGSPTPNGPWQKSLDWMRDDIEDAVEKGVLTPVSELRLSKDKEEDLDKGFVHELSPEILTRGHTVLAAAERKDKIAQRLEFSDYR